MKPTHAMALTALLATTAAVHAQTAPPPGRTFGDGTLPEFLQPYDTNNDGMLSAEEHEAARKARAERLEESLAKWDTDGDGKLSPAEIEAARQAMHRRIEDLRLTRFLEADLDQDGALSLEEFSKMVPKDVMPPEAIARVFDFLDADANGAVSQEEFLRSFKPRVPAQLPAFEVADADDSNDVTLEEFIAACAAVEIPEVAARDIFSHQDRDRDGKLVLAEYPAPPPQPKPLPPFGVADANGDKVVTLDEFMTACLAAGFTEAQAREAFGRLDWNRDGKLALGEYPGSEPPKIPPFDVADADKNKEVTQPEFMAACLAAGFTENQAKDLFLRIDGNRDGKLVLGEYPGTLPPPPQPKPLPAFEIADRDHNGVVSHPEFMLAAQACMIPPLQADGMFRQADASPKDGLLSAAEYGTLLTASP